MRIKTLQLSPRLIWFRDFSRFHCTSAKQINHPLVTDGYEVFLFFLTVLLTSVAVFLLS